MATPPVNPPRPGRLGTVGSEIAVALPAALANLATVATAERDPAARLDAARLLLTVAKGKSGVPAAVVAKAKEAVPAAVASIEGIASGSIPAAPSVALAATNALLEILKGE